MTALLEVQGLRTVFKSDEGEFAAVDGVSFSVDAGRTLAIVGEAFPGRPFEGPLGPGQAVKIMTGAPLPAQADTVLPAELAQFDGSHLRAHGEVAPGKHVGAKGEDVRAGQAVLAAGRVLRQPDFGILLAMTHAGGPSVIQVRTQDVSPTHLGDTVVSVLTVHRVSLSAGALVTVDEARSRVRILPIQFSADNA